MPTAQAAVQTSIVDPVDVDELHTELRSARATIQALSERIEQLDPTERHDTMDGLLHDAANSLRRIYGVTGPIELLGTGVRSDVEQLATTALDSISDALARLADAPF